MLQEMAQWSCPLPGGGAVQEWALTHRPDGDEKARLLIVPALFDEGNKMRRFTVEVMRRLSASGIACFLPDLPGLNESGLPLEEQTPSDWQAAMEGAARHFGATHMLAIRGGALAAPRDVPAGITPPRRGQPVAPDAPRPHPRLREAGRSETQDSLLEHGRVKGLELAGYRLGPDFLSEFGGIVADARPDVQTITQDMLGGPGLWMRPEPGEDASQADALAAVIAVGVAQGEWA
jgi:hypothetical protein